jgi:Flp pilus assembly protein TadD
MRMRRVVRAVPLACLVAAMLFAGACTKKEEAPKVAPPQGMPSVGEVLQNGINHLKRNELEQAINSFSMVVEKANPDAPERVLAYLYLGQIAYRAGNMDLAAQNFRGALALNPDIPQARLNLGNAYFVGGKLDDAIASWEELAKKQPNLASVHNNLGIAYTDKGDLDQAISNLEQAIALAPDNYRTHENLATVYERKGMKAEAEAARHKAQAIKSRQMAGQPGGGAPSDAPGAARGLAETP